MTKRRKRHGKAPLVALATCLATVTVNPTAASAAAAGDDGPMVTQIMGTEWTLTGVTASYEVISDDPASTYAWQYPETCIPVGAVDRPRLDITCMFGTASPMTVTSIVATNGGTTTKTPMWPTVVTASDAPRLAVTVTPEHPRAGDDITLNAETPSGVPLLEYEWDVQVPAHCQGRRWGWEDYKLWCPRWLQDTTIPVVVTVRSADGQTDTRTFDLHQTVEPYLSPTAVWATDSALRYDQTFPVHGEVIDHDDGDPDINTPLTGQVQAEFRRHGAAAFTSVGTPLPLDAENRFRLEVPVTRPGDVRIRYLGDPTHAASVTSFTLPVRPATKLAAQSPRRGVVKATLTTTAGLAVAGNTVAFEVRRKGRWAPLGFRTTNARGAARMHVTRPLPATIRVKAPAQNGYQRAVPVTSLVQAPHR